MLFDSLATKRYATSRHFSHFLFYNRDWRIVGKSNKTQRRDWKVSRTFCPFEGDRARSNTGIARFIVRVVVLDDGCSSIHSPSVNCVDFRPKIRHHGIFMKFSGACKQTFSLNLHKTFLFCLHC